MPIYEIWVQATRSNVAPTVFICLLACIALFSLNGCQQTASRLTWAFARDNALVMSKYLGVINPRFQVPIYALCANSAVIFIIGCIYLASSTAFNALIGTGLVLQQVSFCFPAALLLYRRRSATYLPSTRSFKLGILGWVSNFVTVAFGCVVLIFYNFPSKMPVSGGNMSELQSTTSFSYANFSCLKKIIHVLLSGQWPCSRCAIGSSMQGSIIKVHDFLRISINLRASGSVRFLSLYTDQME